MDVREHAATSRKTHGNLNLIPNLTSMEGQAHQSRGAARKTALDQRSASPQKPRLTSLPSLVPGPIPKPRPTCVPDEGAYLRLALKARQLEQRFPPTSVCYELEDRFKPSVSSF